MLCYENAHGKFNHFVLRDISMRRRGTEGSALYVTHGTKRERRLHWWIKKEVLSGESSGLCRYLVYLITKHASDIWCYGLYVRSHGGAAGTESTCQLQEMQEMWIRSLVRNWQHTPAFLPEQLYGQKSPVGYSPWGLKESEMTEVSKHINIWWKLDH